jgi:hypothetical protein
MVWPATKAGAELVLYSWTEPTGLQPVASATVPDAVAPMWSAEGVVVDVPWESWGDKRAIEVNGTHPDECDLVNDRIDLWVDPCAG